MTGSNMAHSNGFCLEDEHPMRFVGNAIRRFFQGIAMALLMPLDALHFLKHGRTVTLRTWGAWLLSIAVYVCGFEMWTLATQTTANGPGHPGQLLLCTLCLVVAGTLSGKLRFAEEFAGTGVACGGHHRGGWHRHDFHHHRHFHPAGRLPSRPRDVETPVPDARKSIQGSASEICCGDCRQCTNAVCVKTGQPRRSKLQ